MFPEKVPKRLHSLLLTRMLNEFTNPYGIRALSRYHSEHPGWLLALRYPFGSCERRLRPKRMMWALVPGASGKRSIGGYGVGHFSLRYRITQNVVAIVAALYER